MTQTFATLAHDALAPGGAQAAHIATLWWILSAVCAVVFVLVMVAALWAVWRAPRAGADAVPETQVPAARERRLGRSVGLAVALSSILLIALLSASIATDRALATLPLQDAVNVRITAHQWWWEITYDDAEPSRIFSGANQLYVPVGRPVIATLASDDVIHSFWVPNLQGKRDLIPGQITDTWIQADTAGVYRGQCAEFCGLQHAKMAFYVVAEPMDQFQAWLRRQRQPAADPSTAGQTHGREVVEDHPCVVCHSIRGTTLGSHVGPDLTHVGSRRSIAAGVLPNSDDRLDAWVDDPQAIKPGNRMPAHLLSDADRRDVVAYLRSLQ
jgi:cytochrome c oxidase subunit 2